MTMARTALSFLFLFLFLLLLSTTTFISTSAAPNPSASFIQSSCRATTYPAVCVQSLATYSSTIQRSPQQLVMTALSVSVSRTRSARSFISKLARFRGLKPREYAAIKDCLQTTSDGVDRLTNSIRELRSMGRARGPAFEWHLSNLQTWVSSALTDTTTCADGFAGQALNGRIKNSVRTRMTNLGQVTSNALALCNKFYGQY